VARACTVCNHPQRAAIDERLAIGHSRQRVAKDFGLGEGAVDRHKAGHLSKSLTELHRKREERRALSLLDRVEALCARVEAVVDQAEASGKIGPFLGSVKELRALLELYGRLTGELDTRPQVQVNVMQSPDWLAVRQVVMQVLSQYPGAPEELDARLLALEAPSRDEATE